MRVGLNFENQRKSVATFSKPGKKATKRANDTKVKVF